MDTLNIPTTNGYMDVPASNSDNCLNLCVTMTNFGLFEITHKDSGMKLYGGFERAATAIAEMLKLEVAFLEIGITELLSVEKLKSQISKSEVKLEVLCSVTIMEYLTQCRQLEKIANEFPWESYEDSPFGRIDELQAKLRGKQ